MRDDGIFDGNTKQTLEIKVWFQNRRTKHKKDRERDATHPAVPAPAFLPAHGHISRNSSLSSRSFSPASDFLSGSQTSSSAAEKASSSSPLMSSSFSALLGSFHALTPSSYRTPLSSAPLPIVSSRIFRNWAQ